MSNRTIELTDELYEYILKVSLREPPVLTELREKTMSLVNRNLQISPEQGQFMAFLVKLINAQKTLDIGVFTGYSSTVVALALPAQGKVVACDIDSQHTKIAQQYWEKAGVSDKIEFHLGPAEVTLQNFIEKGLTNTFDFAFIDADKENYSHYYEQCLKLITPGGIIAIDNVLRGGRVLKDPKPDQGSEIIDNLNRFISKDQRVDISLVPIADGLFLIRKKL
jgi:predicted O-methyltransferase YrrM